MPTKLEQTITGICLTVQAAAGTGAILQNVTSISNIILTWVSIFAGILVIAVNWKKGIESHLISFFHIKSKM